jgi:hypothetical protein
MKKNVFNCLVPTVPRIESALNFLVNAISISYRRSKIFELCHIFRGCISKPFCSVFVLLSGDET